MTSTSNFGVSRREGHDSRRFYERFSTPDLSDDEEINPCDAADRLFVGDSRRMDQVASKSVALVVTSPPYFSGKQYEEDMGEGHIPGSYLDYLKHLTAVLGECRRVLEPGGRMAVNVANLGRKPYRSLSSDVVRILQDDLGLLLRGEIVWQKGAGAAGNCAWGSFGQPSNPVLRDVTERVIVAAKGRFDRAVKPRRRKELGLPHQPTISHEEFMAATLDVWTIPPESAKRIGHPAPYPVALPRRLIELYTYRDDVVLDPFMGSGTTAVACVETDRRFVGFDTEASYVELASQRVAAAREARTATVVSLAS